jgi:nicotinate-nucleotide--dimethylbenzimidazole phosphoribosyltransferase
MSKNIEASRFEAAQARQNTLLKIPGSLSLLEEMGNRVAAIQGTDKPSLGKGAVVVCCGDHGVVSESVTGYPDFITRIQVGNFLAGGAAINQVAATSGADVWVVDAGTKGEPEPDHPRLIGPRVRPGCGNIAREPAMTREETLAAIELGREGARRAIAEGAQVLCAGDMGIGNTTPAAALTCAYLGLEPDLATGRGSGLDDAGRSKKAEIVSLAVARARQALGPLDKADPLDVLAHLGSLEIAAIAGVYLEGAERGLPLVCDGYPVTSGVLAASRMDPNLRQYLFAGHQSAEPGHAWQLRDLGLEPVFKLGLRLGEGTGAVLAIPVLRTACQILSGMRTFADVGLA